MDNHTKKRTMPGAADGMSRDQRRETGEPTRERILNYLREHRLATASGLSLSWGLTRADIRYHLNQLVEEGLVELSGQDTHLPPRRGRPSQSYRLAVQTSPDNFSKLCHALLNAYLKNAPDAKPHLVELARSLAGDLVSQSNPARQFNQAVSALNQMRYHARWEAHASGPRVLLRSCPYAAILPDHPELCQLDQHLLEILLSTPVKHIAQMNLETGHPPACVFGVGNINVLKNPINRPLVVDKTS